MKLVILLVLAAALCGCSDTVIWRERQIPVTAEEREAIATLEKEILANASQLKAVGGDDQDWEDVIIEAHNAATKTACPVRLWEYVIPFFGPDYYTGRYESFSPIEAREAK